jgi:hypothetical protein
MSALMSTILALIGGLLGAVIGGMIAGRESKAGSIEGARIATAHAEELFRKERDLREGERRTQIHRAFLDEMRLNTQHVGDMLGASYAQLLTTAWLFAQGDLRLLNTETARRLTEVYGRIRRYNDGAARWDPNTHTRDPIDTEARSLRLLMQGAIENLEREH